MRLRLRHRRLARELAEQNLSQNRWAQKLGLSSAHLSLLVNGRRSYPNAETRRKLLQGLSLSREELFEIELPLGQPSRGGRAVKLAPRNDRPRLQVPHYGGSPMFTALARDFRYGLRRIARKPGLAATIILSLAIGIGANSAIFSVIDAILFRPLPVRKSQELVALATSDHHSEYPHGLSYGLFRDFRTLTEAFSDALAFQTTLLNFRVGEETRTVISQVASANYFSALGVEPFLGRLFQPQEASRGPEPVVVFSHALWQSLFAADPAMIGNTVWINGSPYTLIGVTP